MDVRATDAAALDEGSNSSSPEERAQQLDDEHWQQVDHALDILAGVARAGHTKEANTLAVELRCHLLSLKKNDQLWQEQIQETERGAEHWRQELDDATEKLNKVVLDIEEAMNDKGNTTMELKTISRQLQQSEETTAQLAEQRATLEIRRLQHAADERERLLREAADEQMRKLKEEEKRRQEEQLRRQEEEQLRAEEARQQQERQQKQEEMQRQQDEEERLRVEAEARAEEQRKAEEEEESARLRLQKEEEEEAKEEQQRQLQEEEARRQQEEALQREQEEKQAEEARRQEAAKRERLRLEKEAEQLKLKQEEDRHAEEVRRQEAEKREQLRLKAEAAQFKLREEEKRRREEEMVRQQELKQRREEEERLRKEVELRLQEAKRRAEVSRTEQVSELPRLALFGRPEAELAKTGAERPETDCQKEPGSVEEPPMASRQPQPVADSGQQQEAKPMSPQDRASDVTELDAATEPIHSEPGDVQAAEVPEAKQALPETAEDKERQRGELFEELSKRLGRYTQERRIAVASSFVAPAEAHVIQARMSAAVPRMVSSSQVSFQQQPCSVAVSTPSLMLSGGRPAEQEVRPRQAMPVSITQVPARSPSPVRVVHGQTTRPGLANGSVTIPQWQQVEGVSSGVHIQQISETPCRGLAQTREGTEPTRGTSPTRFTSKKVQKLEVEVAFLPSAAAPAPQRQGSPERGCHSAAMERNRSALQMPGRTAAESLAQLPPGDKMVTVATVTRPNPRASFVAPDVHQAHQLPQAVGSCHAPVAQQAEFVRQFPASPLYAPRPMLHEAVSLHGSLVIPVSRAAMASRPPQAALQRAASPLRPPHDAFQRAASPIRPAEGVQRAVSPMVRRSARWLSTAEPPGGELQASRSSFAERPEETCYVGMARLADHVRRYPQTVQTITGSVRMAEMPRVSKTTPRVSTKTAL